MTGRWTGACEQRDRFGDACLRRDPHGPEDIHRNATREWGCRDPFIPTWLQLARQRPHGLARDETGRSVL